MTIVLAFLSRHGGGATSPSTLIVNPPNGAILTSLRASLTHACSLLAGAEATRRSGGKAAGSGRGVRLLLGPTSSSGAEPGPLASGRATDTEGVEHGSCPSDLMAWTRRLGAHRWLNRPTTGGTVHWTATAFVGIALTLAGCSGSPERTGLPTPIGDDAITVGSFDFPESVLLAELYSQALEAGGFRVERALALGQREFVGPALRAGLIELVPEYAGTALGFASLGALEPTADLASTHRSLVETAAAIRHHRPGTGPGRERQHVRRHARDRTPA